MNHHQKRRLPEDALSAHEIARQTGASLRQLQWWDEQGHVHPAYGIRFHSRQYSKNQVASIARMVQLRKAHISLAQAKACLKLTGWERVIVVDRAVAIGGVLLVPPTPENCASKGKKRPMEIKRAELPPAFEGFDEMDLRALQDPRIARGRTVHA